tara:strand:- start:507 stop:1442 length:936 start_codon:yes stop_codon:yes gene_type:complete
MFDLIHNDYTKIFILIIRKEHFIMEIKSVGVIGAGVMGTGVAQNFSQAGFKVILLDINADILIRAEGKINRDLRLYQMFHRDIKIDSSEVLERICFTKDYNLLKDVDFVVENVFENLTVKETAYEKLNTICSNDCIIAANTSCIPITRIAALTDHPDKVIGIHFMNPVPMKKTVEVIRGYHTTDKTVEITEKLLKRIGKDSIIVNDLPGFVSNRLSHLFMNEAAFVVQDGVATPRQVDEIFKKCYEHKMGPLATADLIGLDTVVNSLDILFDNYKDPKFKCCPLLRKMVHAGLLGRKTKEGFFKYYKGMDE